MTDQFDPTQRGREPFDDPVTGDQTVHPEEGGREAAAAGATSGLPGEVFAKPDPDQPVEGRRDQPETDKALESERGREADADEETLGH